MRLNGRQLTAGITVALLAIASVTFTQTAFSWQQPHATVSPLGDLQLAQQPFVYTPGSSVIYIDYEGGNDNNSGTSQASAFKHHPWDANATGTARTTTGVRTYVFKRGVIYRGMLVANASGTAGNPIKLTSDPAWGSGEAHLMGSERVSTTWTRCTAGDAITNLNPENVWFTDLNFAITDNPYGSFQTWASGIWVQTICEMNDTLVRRINLARAPNWTITNANDPLLNWWTVTGPSAGLITLGATFTQTAASDWIGGSVWCNWGAGSGAGANMATVQQGTITAYSNRNLSFNVVTNPGCKYFLENLPQLLDEPNEYYYCAGTERRGRLYIRLSGDRDPNTVNIEVGARPKIISLINRTNIEISGLTLGITNQPRPGTGIEPPHWNTNDGACQAIEFGGTVSHIQINNCKFRYISSAMAPRRDPDVNPTNFDNIRITDNDIAFNDDQAITIGTRTRATNIAILRNKLYHIGHRQTTRNYSAIPAINVVTATSAEIAGNFIDYCAGTGINTTSGTGTGTTGNQIRVLVHHNKVTTSLLMLNDYGGIEGWGDGPSYFYNNISGNPRGFRSFSGENEYNPWGPAYYFDHAFRHVAINNIAWGINNSTTSAALRNGIGFMQAASNTNYYYNNTIYKFYRAFTFQSPQSFHVGNLSDDISLQFHDDNNTASQLAYAKNVYRGTPQRFSANHTTFGAFQTYLSSGNAISSQLGLQSTGAVMVDPANGDFRPAGQAIGNGAKVFLPWNLPNAVGVWNFYAQPSDYTTIRSDDAPGGGVGNVLRCPGATAASYVAGALETWTNGALRFNGSSTYCNTTANTALDMTTNGFIIEAYVKAAAGGTIAAKSNGSAGYVLDIDATGRARMRLFSGGEHAQLSSAVIGDNAWHHVVAEVDRAAGRINMFVDGSLSNGTATGSMPAAGASLTTTAAFEVGRNGSAAYLNGDLDFLRVAKGTFAIGATSYEELYAWQFDGPATRDFAGVKVTGVRDAGALQYQVIGVQRGANRSAFMPQIGMRYLGASQKYVISLGAGLASSEPVRISVLNAAGRVVWSRSALAGELGAQRTVEIGTARWAHGVYILRVDIAATQQVLRLPMFR